MLIELLSMSNYVHFNVKLAQVLGLHASIYLGQIMDINEKAIRKKKVENDHFTLDREYIKSRTTITEKEQLDIDKTLIKLGILETSKDDPNSLKLNIAAVTSIMTDPDEQLTKAVKRITKAGSKETKLEAMITKIKEAVITTQPELRKAYFDWIEAVFECGNYMTQSGIIAGQAELDKFTNRNLDVALKVLQIAATNGYRDIMWAISNYKTNYSVTYSVKPSVDAVSNTPRMPETPLEPRIIKRAETKVF